MCIRDRLKLVQSWLEERDAVVVVNGSCSARASLRNQVFQGTVWGPPLWNVYFSDARFAVQQCGLLDTFFADDLNCFQAFSANATAEEVYEPLQNCQKVLHEWGAANHVKFDADKETLHVLHRRSPAGESFKVLGVLWDTKLLMDEECEEVCKRANWKLTTLLRTRRYYDTTAPLRLFKAHVPPTLELSLIHI